MSPKIKEGDFDAQYYKNDSQGYIFSVEVMTI